MILLLTDLDNKSISFFVTIISEIFFRLNLSNFLETLLKWYAKSLAKYVQEPSFFCKALFESSPNKADLNISLLIFFQSLFSSPLGGSKYPSSTWFSFLSTCFGSLRG